jgi:hypothetical protein
MGGEILQKERADKSHRRTGNGTRKRSGKGTPGELEAEPAREPGKELPKRIRPALGRELEKELARELETELGGASEKRPARESEASLARGIGNETHVTPGKLG